jgi:hypothetical protein
MDLGRHRRLTRQEKEKSFGYLETERWTEDTILKISKIELGISDSCL